MMEHRKVQQEKTSNSRRRFLKTGAAASVGVGAAASAGPLFSSENSNGAEGERPNIILAMADDLSWNGLAYIGAHDTPVTPNLDKMSTECLRLDRFYACPVCSPARAGSLTGRYPSREGVMTGGRMEPEEVITLPQILSAHGYATSHFGKWHLGEQDHMKPESRGYQESFWNGNNCRHVDPDEYKRGDERVGVIEGDDSEILANEVLAFAQRSEEQGKPFFATLWFHAPHSPHGSTQKYRDLYPGMKENKVDMWSDISAVDGAMGILREGLKNLGITENTMLWFNSDNGRYPSPTQLRGSKGSLGEGGIRVPALLEWPAKVKEPRLTTIPAGIFDFLPTILDYLGISTEEALAPLDGISLRPLIDGTWEKRPEPLAFQWSNWDKVYDPETSIYALIDNDLKLAITPEGDALYDLVEDVKEKQNIIDQNPDKATEMKTYLSDWIVSMENSLAGEDYSTNVVSGKERLKFPTTYQFTLEQNALVIRSNRLLSGTIRAELMTVDGRTIHRWAQASPSGRLVRLGLPAMSKGSYVVRLLQPDGKDVVEKITLR